MKRIGYILKICAALIWGVSVFVSETEAQIPFTTDAEKTETRNGNKQYNKGDYADAEASYKKALDKKNNMPQAMYNLGNAVYMQKRYDEAIKQFQLTAQTNPDPAVRAKAYHNLGNTYLQQQKWQEAVNAYKQALKINPDDKNTKYNLAYANAKLKEQQQNGGQNDQKDKNEKNDKKDQDKQQNNQDKKNDKQQQSDKQQNQEKQEQQKEQQQKQGQQPKLSKEEAEKLLQALQGEEQKTNQKVQQKQMKVVPIKIQKDW